MREQAFLTSLIHSEECGRSMLYDVYGNEVCSIADIVNHIDGISQGTDGQYPPKCGNPSEAIKDSQRLDWLESQWREGVILDVYGTCDDVERGIGANWNCEFDAITVQASTIREALDAALGAS